MRSATQHCGLNLSAVYTPTRMKHSGLTLPQYNNEEDKRKDQQCLPPSFATPSRSHLRKTIGSPLGIDSISSKRSANHEHSSSFIQTAFNKGNAPAAQPSSYLQHPHSKSYTSKKEISHSGQASKAQEGTESNYDKIMQKIDHKEKILKELKELQEFKLSEKIKLDFEKGYSSKKEAANIIKDNNPDNFNELREKILNKIVYSKPEEQKTPSHYEQKSGLAYYTPKVNKQGAKQAFQTNTPKVNARDLSHYSYLNASDIRPKYSNQNASMAIENYSPTVSLKSKEPQKEVKLMRDIKQIISTTQSVKSAKPKLSIHDFILGRELGQGKFGTVYQAIHKKTNFLVALKKISKTSIKSNYLIDQFLLEIKIQSHCEHQNILTLYGHFDDREYIYLVLEYMEEGTLFKLLKKKKCFNQEETSERIAQVASAIKYLHERGIAHRDIKPENIVISNGVGKLCDFGWATLCNQRRKTYCGTFDYAAPEILEGVQYDLTVDLWCLGVLAYELLVGKAPFYHISRKETMKKILNVEYTAIDFPPSMSKTAVSFIEGLIRKNPEERMTAQNILKHPFLTPKI